MYSKISHSSIEKRKKENFPVGSFFLPKDARSGVIAFYNFARHADDIADNPSLSKGERLDILVSISSALSKGDENKLPEWAVPYFHHVKNGDIDPRHGQALLSAFIQDVTTDRYESWDKLIDYCMRSAAPVGRAVLEFHNEWTADQKASDTLCNVLQILNHLQDLKKDFTEKNRVYFPESWLSLDDSPTACGAHSCGRGRGGCPLEIKEKETKKTRNAINLALDKIDKMLDEAAILPSTISGYRIRLEVSVIYHIARSLSEKLRKNDPIAGRVELTKSEKIKCFAHGISTAFHHQKKKKSSVSKSSFFLPLTRLPKEKRDAMFALYAFCREADDAVDEARNTQEAKNNILFWRNELESLFNKNADYPSHHVTRSLLPHIKKYNLKREYFEEILNGQEMDLKEEMIKPSIETLDLYCYRVASCVGLLSIEIFGYKNQDTKKFAIHLGKGLQLINILRDVKEDAERGRIYLPMEELEKAGLEKIWPVNINKKNEKSLKKVYVSLAEEAKEHFKKADSFLSKEDKKNMKPALLMRKVYFTYLRTIAP